MSGETGKLRIKNLLVFSKKDNLILIDKYTKKPQQQYCGFFYS